MKKMNHGLNIIIGAFIGVFVGHSTFVIWDVNARPELYAMQAAPWYTSILLYGAFTAVVVIAALIAKCIIRKKMTQ